MTVNTSSFIQTSRPVNARHCRSRSFTGSVPKREVADCTADRDFHPALKTSHSVVPIPIIAAGEKNATPKIEPEAIDGTVDLKVPSAYKNKCSTNH